MKQPDVIRPGTDSGEDMIVRYRTGRGTEVFGLAIPNIHDDTEWDLGPTWCYLILAERTVLIDTGRFGNLEVLDRQLRSIGKGLQDIDVIIPTHSHEDHDGNLPDVLPKTGAELWAHALYRQMISFYPDITDGAPHPELPGSCRSCAMPEKFIRKNCISYHRKRSRLNLDFPIEDSVSCPIGGMAFLHTPGHSPDAVCIVLEDEVIFTGDTVLPGITPHPSRAFTFQTNRRILPQEYQHDNRVYGLMSYIRSLRKIAGLDGRQQYEATFPAHRLFYNAQFHLIHRTADRAREIVRFHMDRCRDILEIVHPKPLGLDEIAVRHFTPSQLRGYGMLMARNELLAHIEVMEACGDVRWAGASRDLLEHSGTYHCLDFVGQDLA